MSINDDFWEELCNSPGPSAYCTDRDLPGVGGKLSIDLNHIRDSLSRMTDVEKTDIHQLANSTERERCAYLRGMELLQTGQRARAVDILRKVPNLLIWCLGRPSPELAKLCEEENIPISTAADLEVMELESDNGDVPCAAMLPLTHADRLPRVLPLAGYELFHLTDVEAIREGLNTVFSVRRLSPRGYDCRLDARMNSRRLRDVSISYLEYGGEVRIELGDDRPYYAVQLPLCGRGLIRSGTSELQSTPRVASVLSPGDAATMYLSADYANLICKIEKGALEALLSDVLDESLPHPIQFEVGMDMQTGGGRAWMKTLEMFIQEMQSDDSSINNPHVARSFEQALMTSLLFIQPHNYTSRLMGEGSSAFSRPVSRVIDYMESRPELPHTVSGLARSAGVSVRALQAAFRRHCDTTPMAYLRDVRLRRVRDELRASDAKQVTVASVATRWGFVHLGRFSAFYRERFGEGPMETLRGKEKLPRDKQVASRIAARIVAGDLPVGAKLPDVNTLAEEYGVTHVIVRNATRLLRNTSLIDAPSNREFPAGAKRKGTVPDVLTAAV